MLDYPAPRYPKLRRPKSVEELMPKARKLLAEGTGPYDPTASNILKPNYSIKAGDKVLLVALSEYNPWVFQAMYRAIREKGAHIDLMVLDSTPVAPPEELMAHEAIAMGKEEGDYSYYYTGICNLLRLDTGKKLVELEKYTMIIAGTAGGLPADITFPWHHFNFPYLEHWASPMIDSPTDLLQIIDDKTWAQIMASKTMRLTDPEGTDVSWTNYDDKRLPYPNHLDARPVSPGYGFNGKDDCTGVLAGTLGHLGAFPHCKAYIEGGQVVKVEGGGKYGDVWREKLQQYKNVKLPPLRIFPDKPEKYEIKDPGGFWFFECAIGTIPGAFRTTREAFHEYYANCLSERRRAGYIHFGLGFPLYGWITELVEAGLPWTHVHIHSLFGTLEGKTSTGKKIKIIDKGHLTSLDDPEVRALAKKHGDPDELLKEAWIPAMPGINVPGDYMRDYGRDPISWMRKEGREHPTWVD